MADKLYAYRTKNPLILAIPRGAIPTGEILAEQLDGICHGAVDENGRIYMTEASHRLESMTACIETATGTLPVTSPIHADHTACKPHRTHRHRGG